MTEHGDRLGYGYLSLGCRFILKGVPQRLQELCIQMSWPIDSDLQQPVEYCFLVDLERGREFLVIVHLKGHAHLRLCTCPTAHAPDGGDVL